MNPLGNSAGMDLRRSTFLPYRIARQFPLYHENPEVFIASSLSISPDHVYARDTFKDDWTMGGERVRLLLQGVTPGRLELDVASWARPGRRQHFRVHLGGSRVLEGTLPPNGVATAVIDLHEGDLTKYPRFLEGGVLAYVDLEAEPWVPKWDAPQLSTDDRRRLGVRLLGVRSAGRTLFSAAR
jgi:hypothetical protein